MNNDFYYNTSAVSLAERETFNNTIILLTLIKSQYYYIVGFSRPNNLIEVAFDFESELHSSISESLSIDFGSNAEYVQIHATIKHISPSCCEESVTYLENGTISVEADTVVYNCLIKKDKLIPTSIEKMNQCILVAKNEIITFVERCFENQLV